MTNDSPEPNTKDKGTPRPIKTSGIPFCWQERAVLRHIRSNIENCSYDGCIFGVYLVLTELASITGVPTFTESRANIASLAGISKRTFDKVAAHLKRIGVLDWKENFSASGDVQLASTYTLLKLPETGKPQRKSCATPAQIVHHPSAKYEKHQICAHSKELERTEGKNTERKEPYRIPNGLIDPRSL